MYRSLASAAAVILALSAANGSGTYARDRTGYIHLVTDNREGKPAPILRMEPVERAPVK